MNNEEFISKLKAVDAQNTRYMWGTFGALITNTLIDAKARQYPSWYTATKQASLRALVGKGYYAFDCIGLIKGILWGWDGSSRTSTGGAVYASNGMPDTSANGYILKCSSVSTNFSNLIPGEVVWLPGHIGVYIGNGEVIEATPSWESGVQKTKLSARKWEKHGKMPQLTYVEKAADPIAIKSTLENLNMRTGPGAGYGIIVTIPKGTDVQIYSIANGWAKVSYKDKMGYCSTQYLGTEAPDLNGKVVASALNVRSGAGTSYRVIGQFANGFVVDVLGKSGNWYKVRYGTRDGYISADYVELTTAKPTVVVTSLRGKVVRCDSLHIRRTPGGTSIGGYKRGDVVTILSKEGSWYKTDKGYSSANYIDII